MIAFQPAGSKGFVNEISSFINLLGCLILFDVSGLFLVCWAQQTAAEGSGAGHPPPTPHQTPAFTSM